MPDLDQNKNRLYPLRRFAESGPYSLAYLSNLVQRGKLKAEKQGRNYYTTHEWFNEYISKHATKRIEEPKKTKSKLRRTSIKELSTRVVVISLIFSLLASTASAQFMLYPKQTKDDLKVLNEKIAGGILDDNSLLKESVKNSLAKINSVSASLWRGYGQTVEAGINATKKVVVGTAEIGNVFDHEMRQALVDLNNSSLSAWLAWGSGIKNTSDYISKTVKTSIDSSKQGFVGINKVSNLAWLGYGEQVEKVLQTPGKLLNTSSNNSPQVLGVKVTDQDQGLLSRTWDKVKSGFSSIRNWFNRDDNTQEETQIVEETTEPKEDTADTEPKVVYVTQQVEVPVVSEEKEIETKYIVNNATTTVREVTEVREVVKEITEVVKETPVIQNITQNITNVNSGGGSVSIPSSLSLNTLDVSGLLSAASFSFDSGSINNSLSVGGDLNVGGFLSANHLLLSSLGVSGFASANKLSADELSVSGDVHFGGDTFTLDSAVDLNNGLDIDSAGEALTVGDGTSDTMSINTTSDVVNVSGAMNISPVSTSTNVLTVADNVYISADGNVGIGTSSPAYALSVIGDVYFDGTLNANGFAATSSMTGPYFTATDATATSTFAGGLTVADSFNVLQNGNVGIGTTTPTAKLEVVSTELGNNGTLVVDGGETDGVPLYVKGSRSVTKFSVANLNETSTSNITKFGFEQRVNNPTSALGTRSLFEFQGKWVDNEESTRTAQADLYVADNGEWDPRLTIRGSNVGIGTTTPGERLDVAGNINLTGELQLNGSRILTATSTSSLFVGHLAGASSQDPSYSNTYVGYASGYSGVNNYSNTFLGRFAGYSNTANQNTFIGREAGYSTQTGGNNVALGYRSGYSHTTGVGNTILGVGAGNGFVSGSYNVFIGQDSRPSDATTTNEIVIGYNAIGAGENTVVLGNDSITTTALKGNVGIGTTTPGAKLDINNGNILLRDTYNIGWLGDGATKTYIYGDGSDDGYLAFRTYGTDRMYISNGGKIGIGTSSPTEELNVNGTSNVFLRIAAEDDSEAGIKLTGDSAGEGWIINKQSGSGNDLRFYSYGLGDTAMAIDYSSGNVGIGTNNPNSKLEIQSSSFAFRTLLSGDNIFIRDDRLSTSGGWARAIMGIEDTNGDDYFQLGGYGNAGQSFNYGYIGQAYNDAAIKWDADNNVGINVPTTVHPSYPFQVGSSDLVVNSSGNVGIGESNSSRKLYVNDSTDNNKAAVVIKKESSAGANSGLQVHTAATSGAGANYYIAKFTTGGTDVDNPTNTAMLIGRSGLVGIGTTTPQYDLDVAGNINIDSSSAYLYDGVQALKLDTSSGSTFVGNAGNSGANYQTAVGSFAGVGNTGDYQTVLGASAGYRNEGGNQIAIGYNAGNDNSGGWQTALGYYTGYHNVGSHQIAIGRSSGSSNEGEHQIAIGRNAGNSNTGDYVTSIGYETGVRNTGDYVTGIGYYATSDNTANNVVAIGYQAGMNNTTANQFIVQQANINATPLIQGDFSTGYVGIGTTSPQGVLHVRQASDANLIVKNGTVDNAILLDFVDDNNSAIRNQLDAYEHQFFINGTQKMKIDSSGNVGIGTDSPLRLLHVNSSDQNFIRIESNSNTVGVELDSSGVTQQALQLDTGNNLVLRNTAGTHSGDIYFDFKDGVNFRQGGTTNVLKILNNGNVGIGTTSPSARLSVSGDMLVSGALTVDSFTTGSALSAPYFIATDSNATSTFAGNISMSGDIIPSADNTYSLGSAGYAWKDVYIGPGSLYVNGKKVIEEASDTMVFTADENQNLSVQTSGSGDIEFNPTGTGLIQLKGNVELTAGKYLRSSDGNPIDFSDGILGGNISLADNLITANNTNGGIEISPNGTGNTYITSGNLGIGTTSPASKLAVSGGASIGANYNTAAPTNGLIVEGNVGIGKINPTAKFEVKGKQEYAEGATSLFTSDTKATAKIFGANNSEYALNFGGTSSAKQYIQAGYGYSATALLLNPYGGNVGIGTISPTAKLSIQGIAGDNDVLNVASSTGESILYVDSSGNVGIGTDSPGAKLDIAGSSSDELRLYSASSIDTPKIHFRGLTTDTHIYQPSIGGLQIDTEGKSGSFYVNNGGDVGIGTTTPAYNLDVDGSTRFNGQVIVSADNETALVVNEVDDGNRAIVLQGGTVSGNVKLYHEGTETTRLTGYQGGDNYFNNGGNVGIGTTNPGAKLAISDSSSSMTMLGVQVSVGSVGGFAGIGFGGSGTDGRYKSAIGHVVTSTGYGVGDLVFAVDNGIDEDAVTITDEKMRITSSGDVGIGTTSPEAKLHVSGGNIIVDNNYGYYTRRAIDGGIQPVIRVDSDDDIIIGSGGLDKIKFVSDEAPNAMFIDTNGEVGIGTDSPSEKLEVANGSIQISHNSSAPELIFYDSSDGDWFRSEFTRSSDYLNFRSNEEASILTLTKTGNVGIGTTTPQQPLHIIKEYGYSKIRLESSTHDAHKVDIGLEWDASNIFQIKVNNASTQVFGANSQGTKVFIPNGNVGIGTTSPSEKLEVLGGNVAIQQNSKYILDKGAGDNSYIGYRSSGTPGVDFYTDGNLGMTIQNNGNIGIGTSSPSTTLHLVGNALFENSGGDYWMAISSHGAYLGDDLRFRPNTDASSFAIEDQSGNPNFIVRSNTGNVGIGVTTPSSKLQVQAESGQNGLFVGASDKRAAMFQGTSGYNMLEATQLGTGLAFAVQKRSNSNSIMDVSQSLHYLESTTATAGLGVANRFALENAAGTNIVAGRTGLVLTDATSGSEDADYFFETMGGGSVTEKLRITGDGNVGIGTSSPGNLLHVYADDTGSSQLRIEQDGSGDSALMYLVSGEYNWYTGVDNSDSNKFKIAGSTLGGSYDFLTIDTGGNVGIGTSNPSVDLQIGGGTLPSIDLNTKFIVTGSGNSQMSLITPGTTGNSALQFGDADDENIGLIQYYHNGDYMTFRTSGSGEDMRIDSSGRVGIGTSSPDFKLHLYDTASNLIKIEKANQGYLAIGAESNENAIYSRNSTGGAQDLQVIVGSDEAMRINESGNVGIGTASPSARLHSVVGTTISSSALFATSDWETATTGSGLQIKMAAGSGDTTSILQAYGTGGNSYGDLALNPNGGNIGIGINNPTSIFQIETDNFENFLFTNTADAYNTIAFDTNRTAADSFLGVLRGKWNGNDVAQINFEGGDDTTNKDDGLISFETSSSGSNPVERMRIDSSGNVGVGTSNPVTKLDVRGGMVMTGQFAQNLYYDSGWKTITNGGGMVWTKPSESDSNFYLGFADYATAGSSVSVTNHLIIDTNNGNVGLGIAGNVGIGTTTPESRFTIKSSANDNSGGLRIVKATANESYYDNYINPNGDLVWAYRGTDMITLEGSGSVGNVGIGTTSPSAKLDIYKTSSAGNEVLLQVGTDADSSRFSVDEDGDIYADGRLRITGWQDEKNYILGGNVGIGTSNPIAKLDIQARNDQISLRIGDNFDPVSATQDGMISVRNYITAEQDTALLFVQSQNDSTANLKFGGGSAILNAATNVSFWTAADPTTLMGTERMTIDSSGNVGIGTTSPEYQLHTTGSVGIGEGEGSVLWLLNDGVKTGIRAHTNYTTQILNSGGGLGILEVGTIDASTFRNGGSMTMDFDANDDVPGAYFSVRQGAYGDPVEHFRITNTGNVGIGTASPSGQLSLGSSTYQTTLQTSVAEGLAGADFRIGLSETNRSIIIADQGDVATDFGLTANSNPSIILYNAAADHYGEISNDNNLTLQAKGANADILLGAARNITLGTSWSSSGANTGTIYAGKGISGQAALSTDLTVNDVYIKRDVDGDGVRSEDGALLRLERDVTNVTSEDGRFLEWGNTGTTLGVIDSSGNVGIGTDSPVTKLDIEGDVTIGVGTVATNGAIRLANSQVINWRNSANSANLGLTATGNNGFEFNQGATPIVRLGSDTSYIVSGNLGIGTTSPRADVEIYSNGVISTLLHGDSIFMRNDYTGSGWARALLGFEDTTGSDYFQIGGYGSGQSFHYGYIGQTWNDNAITWDTDNNVGVGLYGANNPDLMLAIGDPNTGLVGTTTNSLSIYTGGTERMVVDGSGNVGIGTSSPEAKLHVAVSGGSDTGAQAVADDFILESSSAVGMSLLYPDASAGRIYFGSPSNNDAGFISYYGPSNVTTGNRDNMIFGTDGNERMTIDSSGNVGIGTSSPIGLLHLSQSGGAGVAPNADADDFIIDSSGNVGMSILTQDSSTSRIVFGSASDRLAAQLRWSTDNNLFEIGSAHASGQLAFYTGDFSERMRIDSSGNVGIGTSSPESNLEIYGNSPSFKIQEDSNSEYYFKIGLNWNSNDTVNFIGPFGDTFLQYDRAGMNTSIGGTTGNVGIGTTSPSEKLSVEGNVLADEYITSGADYAEYYYTNDTDLVPGELVCVDVENENAVKRCENEADSNVMGIVSLNPSIVGNYQASYKDNPHYVVIGMLGQVAAKVSNENGEIRPGDSLAAASIPGVARRANAGDSTVGVALEALDSSTGMINVLISRKNKSVTVEEVEDQITERIAAMEIEDEVNILISDAIDNLDLEDEISSSVDPKILALDSKINAKAESLGLRIDALSVDLVEIASVYLDRISNMESRLTLVEDKILAIQPMVKGIKIVDGGVNLDSEFMSVDGVGNISVNRALQVAGGVGASQFTVDFANSVQGDLLDDSYYENILSSLEALQLVSYEEDNRSKINFQSDLPSSVLTATGKVDLYQMNTYLFGALQAQQNIIDSLEVRVNSEGEVEDDVEISFSTADNFEFAGSIQVKKQVVFNQDTVGQAKILAGDDSVLVNFKEEYQYPPVVTLTLATDVELSTYFVDQALTTGFMIKIRPDDNDEDILFNWHAFGAEEAKIFVSDGTTEDVEIIVKESDDNQTNLIIVPEVSTASGAESDDVVNETSEDTPAEESGETDNEESGEEESESEVESEDAQVEESIEESSEEVAEEIFDEAVESNTETEDSSSESASQEAEASSEPESSNESSPEAPVASSESVDTSTGS